MVDLGCGTGENAIMFAAHGNRVLGVDAAPLAIGKARNKAKDRGSSAEFIVADAMELSALGMTFDVATDCGLFHTFSDREKVRFAASLRETLKPRGKYFMLCFSEREPTDWGGPRRVRREEIQHTFSMGWKVDSIVPARFEALHLGEGGYAWLASITKSA